MASENEVDMDAGAMASGKKAARKTKPATNGLGSDEVDRLQRWGDVPPTAVEADLSEAQTRQQTRKPLPKRPQQRRRRRRRRFKKEDGAARPQAPQGRAT